jgi:hypothetical protein
LFSGSSTLSKSGIDLMNNDLLNPSKCNPHEKPEP